MRGENETPPRPTTLRDIAAATGLDPSTVSRVLNGDPRDEVKPETRDRVLAAATKLKYSPNHSARSLRLGRAGSFGLLVPDMTHPTYAALVRGAMAEAERSDIIVLITEVRGAHKAAGLKRLIEQRRIDGLLVATGDDDPATAALLSDSSLPIIFVNRTVRGKPTITVDDVQGASLALDALHDVGHRQVGIITGPSHIDTAQRRRKGFVAEAKKLGLPKPVEECGFFTASGGARALRRLLGRQRRPTAVFASNLMSGLGALSSAAELGVHVPDDLSLIVFDDAEIADFTVPPLTRIKMPWEEMGAVAVKTLLDVISGTRVKSKLLDDPPQLILANSLTSPPSSQAAS